VSSSLRVRRGCPVRCRITLCWSLLAAPAALALAPSRAAAEAPAGTATLVDTATPGDTAGARTQLEAREHHRRGLESYDQSAYESALSEFAAAYRLSLNYQLLFNIGQVHYRLGQFAKARQALDSYLRQGGSRIAPSRAERVARQLDELRRRTGVLVLTLDGTSTQLEVQGNRRVSAAREERVLVDAGQVPVTARRAGLAAVERSVWVAAGSEQLLAIRFDTPGPAPLPEQSRRAVVASWAVVGVLSAGALGTGMATVLTSRHYEQLRREPSSGSAQGLRERLDEQRELVRRLSLMTDLLVLLDLAAAGAALYVTLDDSRPDRSPNWALGIGPGQLVALGRF
jgi:hypothetical protein